MRWIALTIIAASAASLSAADISPTVRIVTADQRQSCRYVGLVSTTGRMGINKPKIAFRKAFEEVEKAGGNGLFIVSQTSNWIEGATLTGEALDCPK